MTRWIPHCPEHPGTYRVRFADKVLVVRIVRAIGGALCVQDGEATLPVADWKGAATVEWERLDKDAP